MKKRNQKGFTIMEMLIVVAIIAVLVAIAIPTFSSALTKSKEAADVANIRAAYAEMMMDYMMDGKQLTEAQIKDKIGTLNFSDTAHLTVSATTTTITYKTEKLENSKETQDANKKTFTWSIKDLVKS